jgi:predicted nucleic acid-binding protein
MRGVADTNIVVSGLLWHGPPREVLDAARAGDLAFFTSGALYSGLQVFLAW